MRSRTLVAFAVTAAALAVPSAASAAEEIAGATGSNKILTFGSDSPGNIDSAYPITGLASGEKVVGLDTRPSTGQLYGLGKTGRIYVIDAASGASRAVTGPIAPVPAGSNFGFNFNPVTDRIEITSDSRQNLTVNPDTGTTVAGPAIAYAPGQGGGATPTPGGTAFSNPVPTATSTVQYGLESGKDALVRQDGATGQLTTIGSGLGVGINGPSGFDISQGNVGYASYKDNGSGPVNLYRVDLTGGKVTPAASQAPIGTRAAADDTVAIATLGTVANDKTAPKVVTDAPTSASRVNLSKGRTFFATVALNEAGRVQIDLKVGSKLVAQGKGEVYTRAGAVKIRITPTATGKTLLKKHYKSAKMKVGARDRAGNLKSGTRSFTLR